MDNQSLKGLWWGLALLMLSCVALAGLGVYQVVWNVPELRRNHEEALDALKVISAARGLDRALRDAELSQRNIAITGDARFREPYRESVDRADAWLVDLARLTAEDTEQRGRVEELRRHLATRLAELKGMMDGGRPENPAAILRLIHASVTSPAMTAINAQIDAIIAAENTRLNESRTRAEGYERSARDMLIAANLLVLAVVVLGGFLVFYASHNIRRVESARRETQGQFRMLVGGVTDYAIFRLDPQGRVASWNAGAERIEGYAEDEILGQDFSRFFTEEDRKAGVPQRALAIAAREGRHETEGERVRKDGSRFWASAVIDRLNDASGRLVGYAKVTRDITEKRNQEKALEQTRAELAQSQKMEALGQLTGGIAHDFNNLLTVIGGAVDMIRRRQPQDPDIARFVGAAWRGVDRATGLTQRLLAFARRQPLNPQPLDVNELVAEVIDMARRSVGEAIAIEAHLESGLAWVSADASQLESAILNLVVNARDAMPDGGRLTLETANTVLDSQYAAVRPEVSVGPYVMIAVSDTGRGMSRDVLARAFEPFFTTKEAGQGTGLGLSQVHGFVKQSRGHVSIYSEVGRGTTVKLYLPRLETPPATKGLPANGTVGTRPATRTVLVVEDDADVRAFTVDTLTALGHRVLAAADARTALGVLEREVVDLLFTDVGLTGGVNGRELAEEAKRRHPGLKVLFTTGYTRSAIVVEGALGGDIELITKPYTQTSVAERIQRLLDEDSKPTAVQ